MCDALTVRLVQSAGDLDGILQNLRRRQRTSLQPLRQRLAFQILHDQVVGPVLTADVMDSADMGMVQTRDAARFALEALAQIGAVRQVARKILMATMRSRRVSRAL